MDLGPAYATDHVITLEPPGLGTPYRILVPQVDTDGNDVAGIRLPEVAVPLGTYTGWNVTVPRLSQLGYLAGLVGSFEPFAATREVRAHASDARPSIAERYAGRADYLARVGSAVDGLVRERYLRAEDVSAVRRRAEQMWDAIVGAPRE
jgi:hypothetical protein